MDDMLDRLAVLNRKLDNAVLRILDLMEKNNRSNEEAHEAIGRNINDLRTEMGETMESIGKDLAKLTDMPDQLREVNRRLNDIDTNMGVR